MKRIDFSRQRLRKALRDVDSFRKALNWIRQSPDILDCCGNYRKEAFFKLAECDEYTTFYIFKKGGGLRCIDKPSKKLAFLQLCVAIFLNTIYKPNDNAYGFINGRSIVHNAERHIDKKVIINIDLKDFFNSIEDSTIIEKLIRQPYFFSYPVAKIITEIVTHKGRLPQGAPSSPIISNIVAHFLDVRLSKLAEKNGFTYSRYADDITFSFDNYTQYSRWLYGNNKHKYNLYTLIKYIIMQEGFTINSCKVRTAHSFNSQCVTGLIVNKKVNVKRKYIKCLRTEIHNWEVDGFLPAREKFLQIYLEKSTSILHGPKGLVIHMERVIEGKLCFLRMVKGENDPTYQKLKSRYDEVMLRDKEIIEQQFQLSF